jgi:hypothetical protein
VACEEEEEEEEEEGEENGGMAHIFLKYSLLVNLTARCE